MGLLRWFLRNAALVFLAAFVFISVIYWDKLEPELVSFGEKIGLIAVRTDHAPAAHTMNETAKTETPADKATEAPAAEAAPAPAAEPVTSESAAETKAAPEPEVAATPEPEAAPEPAPVAEATPAPETPTSEKAESQQAQVSPAVEPKSADAEVQETAAAEETPAAKADVQPAQPSAPQAEAEPATTEEPSDQKQPSATTDSGSAQDVASEKAAEPKAESQPAAAEKAEAKTAPALPEGLRTDWAAARAAYWKRDLDQAVTLYEALAKDHADNADIHGELGNVLLQAGKRDKAADAYFAAGQVLLKGDRPMMANKVLGALNVVSPEKADALRKSIFEAMNKKMQK